MKSVNIDKSLIENYFGLLKNLNPKLKSALIERLMQTTQPDSGKRTMAFKNAFGAWNSNQSADEIILELRESRGFYRNTESFE